MGLGLGLGLGPCMRLGPGHVSSVHIGRTESQDAYKPGQHDMLLGS